MCEVLKKAQFRTEMGTSVVLKSGMLLPGEERLVLAELAKSMLVRGIPHHLIATTAC